MFKKLKSWIRRYFGFSATETKGFMVLVILFPLVLALPALLKLVINHNTPDLNANTQQLDSLVALMEEKVISTKKATIESKETGKIKLVRFNPNEITYEEMLSLGLSSGIARRVTNYRSKGGRFKVKEDFKKIYGLSEKQFTSLKDYIDLPVAPSPSAKKTEITKKNTTFPDAVPDLPFDVNKVEAERLMAIKGIGQKLSARIIRFRNKLGGFVTIKQLEEVYGLPEPVIQAILDKGYVADSFRPALLNVNTATADDLATHPYISKKLANQIVNYRIQHGKFVNLNQLMNIHLIDENTYNKMKPYLSL